MKTKNKLFLAGAVCAWACGMAVHMKVYCVAIALGAAGAVLLWKSL